MIGENSFFKRIPLVISLEQRLIWEGAGWAIQMISLSFERLKSAALQIDTTTASYPSSVAAEMFSCCWSIVDQCHMLRKLLERVYSNTETKQAKFIEKFEVVTLMRNAMDHLHQNIKNVSAKKTPVPPVFGALSFCLVRDDDLSSFDHDGAPILKGCKVVTMTAGALTHPVHNFGVVSPAGRIIEVPVGDFQFMAFEYRVAISDLMADLSSLVAHFDSIVKSDQEQQLREFAQSNSLDEDRVLSECGGAFCAVVQITFPSTKMLEAIPESARSQ
jgi:hypothetical protein